MGAGAFAVTGPSGSTATPPLHWGLYSTTAWDALAARVERRGFARSSVRVVTGTKLMSTGRSFALLAARSDSGRTCFFVARGAAPGASICKLSRPLSVFTERDLCGACAPGEAPLKTLTVLGLLRRDVSSVATLEGGRESELGIVPAGTGAFAFNVSGARSGTVLRARGLGAAILGELRLCPSYA